MPGWPEMQYRPRYRRSRVLGDGGGKAGKGAMIGVCGALDPGASQGGMRWDTQAL